MYLERERRKRGKRTSTAARDLDGRGRGRGGGKKIGRGRDGDKRVEEGGAAARDWKRKRGAVARVLEGREGQLEREGSLH